MMNKQLALFLALAIIFCGFPIGAAASTSGSSEILSGGPEFQDVPEDSWYHIYVYAAVKQGLIVGQSTTRFAPDDNLTQAEALALASRCHQLLTIGKVTLEAGNPWYRPFLDYANKYFTKGFWEVDTWDEEAANKPITRELFVALFFLALRESNYEPINIIADGAIPDVPESDIFSEAIYSFYRAGILAGSDNKRTFYPKSNITRAEVAAILTRITYDSPRMQFSLPSQTPDETSAHQESFTAFVFLWDSDWDEYDISSGTAKFYVDDILMLYNWRDRELLEQYGYDPDDLIDDYAIINLVEEWDIYESAPEAQFYVIYHPNIPFDGFAHSVDIVELAEYFSEWPRTEFGIIADVVVIDGIIMSITEIYTP